MILVCRSDKRKVILVWNCENDAVIAALEEIRAVMIEQFFGDNVAAPNEAHTFAGIELYGVFDDVCYPRAACVNKYLGENITFAMLIAYGNLPNAGFTFSTNDLGACENICATFCRIAGVQYYQSGILHPAVRILERFGEFSLQRSAHFVLFQVYRPRSGQDLPSAHTVVDKQSQADQPRRAHFFM